MGTPKTTIELNGKRYDARTGKIIHEGNTLTTPKIAPKTKPSSGAVIDGFVRPNQMLSPALKPKPTTAKTEVKKTARTIQKSQTLMRSGLKKPTPVKSESSAAHHVPRHSHVQAVRKYRADNAEKSPLVSKFGNSAIKNVIKKEAHLPVVAHKAQPAQLAKKASDELERIEQALHGATSHLQQLEHGIVKKAPFLERVGFRHKAANLTAMVAALLLLVGFFGYQNAPAVEMRVAAARSGIDAQLPSYKPAGFSVSRGISVAPGKVSVNFSSRTDDKDFTITQQASNWNSASLLANHVSRTRCNTCYQTWQNNGKTVYIYDNSNATWVSGGIWYEIKGDASLTSDQLLRLANSF